MNKQAFLDTIAASEIGSALLAVSDNGYNVIVGSTPKKPHLFNDYKDHPYCMVRLGNSLESTAAGRYQILAKYFDAYKKILNLPDFGHDSQDRIAWQMINEVNAQHLVNAGDFEAAIKACSSRWASLPGNTYKQHTNSLYDLNKWFVDAGGVLATA